MESDRYDSEAKQRLGDYELPRSEAIREAVKIICNPVHSAEKPELESVKTVVLYRRDRATKFVVWRIRDGESGEAKGKNLSLQTIRRTKARGWETDPDKSITIEDNGIDILRKFLNELPQLSIDGEYLLLDAADPLAQILDALSDCSLEAGDFSKILQLLVDPRNIIKLLALPSESLELGKSVAAALSHARMSRVLDDFIHLVDQGCGECDGCLHNKACREHTYQKFLEANSWIFGSEYSELIPNRNFIKNRQVDFPLRRTVDGYLEVIEIKRPTDDLFTYKDGAIVGESSVVSKARYQVSEYLSDIDVKKNDILVEDDIAAEKVRGKVIVGNLKGNVEEKKALRRLNAQLNRVEIISYDQLIATAQRMLDLLSEQRDVGETSGNEQEAAATLVRQPEWANSDRKYPDTPTSVDDIPF
ncbi:MAG: DUF4263 domain-containing protein [Chloroflexi bacterium]|nr:DUF4263 domain-containing protein [Chloroflexota bacterium]